ncbi:uncharacterized protein LOC119401857 isoform X2 [Rhipicephalus sanguineus]|uniref:uncharacterized protein LOC119401857 isoform X2 n=1 Tax=Rhipicephalus sanguineus TaxID=34632 RepID=UPI001895A1EC|nr:uncharacterized protein LOC119401857 isoform X2 [Rhipicephalus sanguineus]
MDNAEELWKVKRSRERYGSNSEPPPKSAKEGSDGRALFTSEDIQKMMMTALPGNTSTLATVKEERPQEYTDWLSKWMTGGSQSVSRQVQRPSPQSTSRHSKPCTISRSPYNECNKASTRGEEPISMVSSTPSSKPAGISRRRLGTENTTDVSGEHYLSKNGVNAPGALSPKTSTNARSTAEEDTVRPGSEEQVAPMGESSDEQGRLDERLRHLRSRWRAAQRILDEIGARLSRPAGSRDHRDAPAVEAYREQRWNNAQYKRRAVSESRESTAAARRPASSRSQPDSPMEESPGTPTLFDGVFKRPQPVSREPRRTRTQPHTSKTTAPSSAVATRTARTLEEITNAPAASVSPYLTGFSVFLHEECASVFPQPRSFEYLVLDVRRAIYEESAASLDSWCSHSEQVPCWLLTFQGTLTRFLLFYDIEIAEIHLGTYSLHHVDSDFPKRADAEAILDRAREMRTEPGQFLHERECLITWLMRVHRCLRRVRLDLTEVAESPGEFCRGYRLHEGYKVLELGVSGRTLLSGRHLFSFLGHVTQLTELSLFGLYLMHPDDNCRLAALVATNMFLRKLSLKRCQIADRNLDGLIEAAKGLPLLECFSISLLNPGLWIERSQQLSRLLAGTGCRRLRQVHFGVACDLEPMLERLGENKKVIEVQINHELTTSSELMKLCDLAELNTHLKRLSLPIDMESALPTRYYQFILRKFIANARMEVLNLENSFITTRGVKAIAEGLKKNGVKETPQLPSEVRATANQDGRQRYLKELHLRSDKLTCEHLDILVDALDANRTLEVLEVGRVLPTPLVSHADVTRKIIDHAFRQRQHTASSQKSNPAATVRVNKVYFAEEFQLLIFAVRNDVTFRKLNLSFCDSPTETLKSHSFDFSHLLALLPFFAVADTLESLEIDVSLPGIVDVAFMGLSLLAATSNNLTELSVTLADTCCEFASILLFQGLASSVSIRSLTMSGWALKHPVPIWFHRFCRMNESLRKLHVHITCLEADDNTTFYEELPDALTECRWLVDFRLTCGKLREPIFIPEVLSTIRRNQRVQPRAVKVVSTAECAPQRVVKIFDRKLTLDMGVKLRRSMDVPEFKQHILERCMCSTETIDRAIETTRRLVSSTLGHRAKVHRRVSTLGSDPNVSDTVRSGDMDEATQERLFRSLRVRDAWIWDCGDGNVDHYQMRISMISHMMRTIYNEEQKRYQDPLSELQDSVEDIIDVESL